MEDMDHDHDKEDSSRTRLTLKRTQSANSAGLGVIGRQMDGGSKLRARHLMEEGALGRSERTLRGARGKSDLHEPMLAQAAGAAGAAHASRSDLVQTGRDSPQSHHDPGQDE